VPIDNKGRFQHGILGTPHRREAGNLEREKTPRGGKEKTAFVSPPKKGRAYIASLGSRKSRRGQREKKKRKSRLIGKEDKSSAEFVPRGRCRGAKEGKGVFTVGGTASRRE